MKKIAVLGLLIIFLFLIGCKGEVDMEVNETMNVSEDMELYDEQEEEDTDDETDTDDEPIIELEDVTKRTGRIVSLTENEDESSFTGELIDTKTKIKHEFQSSNTALTQGAEINYILKNGKVTQISVITLEEVIEVVDEPGNETDNETGPIEIVEFELPDFSLMNDQARIDYIKENYRKGLVEKSRPQRDGTFFIEITDQNSWKKFRTYYSDEIDDDARVYYYISRTTHEILDIVPVEEIDG